MNNYKGLALFLDKLYNHQTTFVYESMNPRAGNTGFVTAHGGARFMNTIILLFDPLHNPPIDKLHQPLTPAAAALLFATLPAYSLTGKRVGGVR